MVEALSEDSFADVCGDETAAVVDDESEEGATSSVFAIAVMCIMSI